MDGISVHVLLFYVFKPFEQLSHEVFRLAIVLVVA